MLYLEDYIELIEHLPDELRDRLTEMREMDLQVQNSMDSLDHKVENFFSHAKRMKSEDREKDYDKMQGEFKKVYEEADEKSQLSEKIYQLFSKHLKKLDQELNKFKLELEADNSGITEILEKRSLDMDTINTPTYNNPHSLSTHSSRSAVNGRNNNSIVSNLMSNARRLNRKYASHFGASNRYNKGSSLSNNSQHLHSTNVRNIRKESRVNYGYSLKNENTRSNNQIERNNFALNRNSLFDSESSSQSSQIYRRGTHKFLKSSSNKNMIRETIPSSPSLSSNLRDYTDRYHEKHTRHPSTNLQHSQAFQNYNNQLQHNENTNVEQEDFEEENEEFEEELEDEDDPDEPRYCTCNQVSYGEMVACDNNSCPYEWFHYACVGVTQPPKGKWYCPECSISAAF
ncbi:unnamed protein product [Gordionus sp. m RMFG-2023]|uniref:inhibitor of growth protein 3-like isoform X2 n=1 Tax=Gordionus sp. m RMFG-2023 TaxID=3053472 RepID=UPI0030E55BBA